MTLHSRQGNHEPSSLRVENRRLRAENERLRNTLTHIATMECYTRDGEEPAHQLMMRLAQAALEQDSGNR